MKSRRVSDRERGAAKACALLILTILVAGSFAAAQVAPPGNAPGQEDLRISVQVDLVVLEAAVRDRRGHSVPGLTAQNFEVREDGNLQPVRLFRHEDSPVTVGLVVDHSGSMREKLGEVTAAARAFVLFSNPADQMFVVNFNENVSPGLSGARSFSNDADELGRAIGNAPALGMTALYDAIVDALRSLRDGKWDKKALIVVSDGGDNASQSSLDDVLRMAEQSRAVIYTIGVFDEGDPDRNPKVLRRLARETGGEAFFPSELKQTVEICKRIARDVRDQYTIGYSSLTGKPGTYRAIRLTARSKEHGKLTVRTRAGYIAGEARTSWGGR